MDINNKEPIVIVSGCDEGYVMPLAVTIRSAIDQLGVDRSMKVYVLDGGIAAESKQRLLKSWHDTRVRVEFVAAEIDQLQNLPIDLHVTAATYLRLLIPELLPPDVERAIYLDADMLVRRDLGELWDQPQDGHAVLAVQDYSAPYVDSSVVLPQYDSCRHHLAKTRPIANCEQLGLAPDAMYFNGGLLVIDVAIWRRDGIAKQLLDCLNEHRQHVLWWDQYALNVVLNGRWGTLDLRWNQGAHLYVYPRHSESPFDRLTFELLKRDPWVIHFCSPSKPWHYYSRHPGTSEFYESLQRTDWKDFQPKYPDEPLRKWWAYHYKPLRQKYKNRLTRIKRSIRSSRRAA